MNTISVPVIRVYSLAADPKFQDLEKFDIVVTFNDGHIEHFTEKTIHLTMHNRNTMILKIIGCQFLVHINGLYFALQP